MENILLNLDSWLFDLINQKGSFEWGDQLFPWITDLHLNKYFLICVVLILLFFFLKKFKRQGSSLFFILLLALSVSDFFGAQVKNYFERPRPFENPEIVATQKSPAGSKSFYSNHASNIFTFATYTSCFFPAAKVPLYVFASTIGYSRVYNGVHYPSDVLAGSTMGLIWGILFSFLGNKVLLRLKSTEEKK